MFTIDQSEISALLLSRFKAIALPLTAALAVTACSSNVDSETPDDEHQASTPNISAASPDRLPADEIIYFMLPDRFANGDEANDRGGIEGDRLDHGFDPTHRGFYHGGDLVGLTQKLDYIEGMGVTAIWLGPIYKNKPVQGALGEESSGYHGYWITDFTTVDPHLGTEEDLVAFINEAHGRDMKVYLDIITNHTADVIAMRECHDPAWPEGEQVEDGCPYRARADYPFTTRGGVDGESINPGFLGVEDHLQTPANFAKLTRDDYAYTPWIPEDEENVKVPSWLNDPIYYHNRGESHWSGQSAIQGDFSGLDDLMTEHPVVIDGMIDIFKEWITKYRVDGFRVDTAKHVNPGFWKRFVPAMKEHAKDEGIANFYIFGEAYYEGEPEMLAWHTREGGYDHVLDFAFAETMQHYLDGSSAAQIFEKLFYVDDLYLEGQTTAMNNPTFISNHDKGRLSGMIKDALPEVSGADLLAKVRLAHQLMLFTRGVPVIYSGDEQGFVSDGNDQLARENMFKSQVEEYNDNDLLGTNATTADDNFDGEHPLYLAIRAAAKVRQAHRALRRGKMVPRLMEAEGQGLAFSRFDPETGHEYVIIVNGGADARSLNIQVDPNSATFNSLLGTCPASVSATGIMTTSIAPFELIVCLANEISSRPKGSI